MAHGDQRKALIVGINDYPGAKLKGCVNDAEAMHQVLRRHAKLDPNFACRLLLSSQVKVDKKTLEDQFTYLFEGDCDMALLYFSGHGSNLGDRFQLVTQDYTDMVPGVEFEWIMGLIQNSKIKEIVLIFDCCRAGGAGNMGDLTIPTAQLRQGVSILAATSADGVAVERMGHGKFTSILIRGLEGAAIDLVGHVTTASLYAYADSFLTLWEQRPMYKAHLSGLTALRYCYPKVRKDYLRQIPDLFPKEDAVHAFSSQGTATKEDLQKQKILRKLRMQGLVIGQNGFTIAKEIRTGGGCLLTEAGKDVHKMVLKGKI